jgi:hypothetical protein
MDLHRLHIQQQSWYVACCLSASAIPRFWDSEIPNRDSKNLRLLGAGNAVCQMCKAVRPPTSMPSCTPSPTMQSSEGSSTGEPLSDEARTMLSYVSKVPLAATEVQELRYTIAAQEQKIRQVFSHMALSMALVWL